MATFNSPIEEKRKDATPRRTKRSTGTGQATAAAAAAAGSDAQKQLQQMQQLQQAQRKAQSNAAAAEPALVPVTKTVPAHDELQQMQYNTDEFGGMRAECNDDDFLYRVCHVANDLLDSASILVRESGMTIQTTDPQSVAVVIIDMPARMFSSYRCEGFVVAHVNMETIVNMLKKTGSDHAKFKLTLEIRADDPEMMVISIFDKKKRVTTNHRVKLWEPKDVIIYFDQAQFPNYRVVSSRAWHEEINNLSHLVDLNKPIRIVAGNDIELGIEDEYGESATKFEQNVTPGYKIVQKPIDACAKDADGNYSFFNEIEGLAEKGAKQQPTAAAAAKKARAKKVLAKKRRRISKDKEEDTENDEDGDDDDDDDEELEGEEESGQYLSLKQLGKFATPLIEDDAEDALLLDKPAERIEPVKLTLSLLLLKMISKGLRLNPELYLLIKKNYPMMFVQRVKTHGRILIALSPKLLEDDEATVGTSGLDEINAMDSVMALNDARE